MPLTDADRQAAVAALRTHAGAGHIDLDAFGDRTALVLEATTVTDLKAEFADLPGGVPALPSADAVATVAPPMPPAHAHPRSWGGGPRLGRLAPVAPLALLFVAIWAVTGFGYFWPAWPIMGISIGALKGGRCWRSPHWV